MFNTLFSFSMQELVSDTVADSCSDFREFCYHKVENVFSSSVSDLREFRK